MRILVTGASGFVGRYVIEAVEAGHEVRLFSRRHPRDGREKLETAHPHVAGDLAVADDVRRAVEGVDAVAHVGANPWIGPDTMQANVTGTVNLLEACREHGVRRVVIAGSDWGMGKSEAGSSRPRYLPVDEAHPMEPHDVYGLSKALVERVAEMYARDHAIACAVLRMTGVWKPGQTAGYRATSRATAAADLDRYWWTYVDVRDVASAFRAALEAPALPAFGTYLCSAADTLLDEPTLDAVRARWPGMEVRGPLPGHASVLSTDAARRAFGWAPAHSWR